MILESLKRMTNEISVATARRCSDRNANQILFCFFYIIKRDFTWVSYQDCDNHNVVEKKIGYLELWADFLPRSSITTLKISVLDIASPSSQFINFFNSLLTSSAISSTLNNRGQPSCCSFGMKSPPTFGSVARRIIGW